MNRLTNAPELLDGPLESAALEGNLVDLTRVNRLLGGISLSWRALLPYLSRERPTTLLDVGTGAADIPRALLHRAGRHGLPLTIRATDVRPEIVAIAQRESAGIRGLEVALVDEGRIDARDPSWDVVHSSLLLHHLEGDAGRQMLAEMGRVARRAVIVNDLERGRGWWLAAWLLTRVATGNRYTRHDAPLSVRRAYRPAEIRALAGAAGLRFVALYRARPAYRYSLVFEPAGSPADD